MFSCFAVSSLSLDVFLLVSFYIFFSFVRPLLGVFDAGVAYPVVLMDVVSNFLFVSLEHFP